jgi:hypothetical protein
VHGQLVRVILAAGLLAACAATSALAQQASAEDVDAVNRMFPCLAEGLPKDWQRLEVTVELDSPGAATGNVSYKFATTDAQPSEDFRPCDPQQAANIMLDLRQKLAPERRGWVRARLALKRDGSFGLKYDYAK